MNAVLLLRFLWNRHSRYRRCRYFKTYRQKPGLALGRAQLSNEFSDHNLHSITRCCESESDSWGTGDTLHQERQHHSQLFDVVHTASLIIHLTCLSSKARLQASTQPGEHAAVAEKRDGKQHVLVLPSTTQGITVGCKQLCLAEKLIVQRCLPLQGCHSQAQLRCAYRLHVDHHPLQPFPFLSKQQSSDAHPK